MSVVRTSRTGSLTLAVVAALLLPASPPTASALPNPDARCTVYGTEGPDTLTGTPGEDVICGRGGDDTISGLGGEDLIRAGGGADTVNGGPGGDRILGGAGDDELTGSDGDDRILGEGGADLLNGSNNADTLRGGPGTDDVRGGSGLDDLSGGADADTVNGGDGADELVGGGAADSLLGSAGDDRLHGGPGDDTVNGGDDADDVRGGDGNDTLLGGNGDDLLQDRDGGGFVDDATCGAGTDRANMNPIDTVNADCEVRRDQDQDDPVGVDDAVTVAEDDASEQIDVLANDTDADGGPREVLVVSQPANGSVIITNSGADVTYSPDQDYCNDGVTTDDFTYTLAPGGDTATVAVTVTCVADDPRAIDDADTVAEDAAATTVDVLANDEDPDSAGLSIASVTQPTDGTVVITNAGADLTYEPDDDYCNDGTTTDDFTYTLAAGGDTATVEMTVTCANDDPVAVDDTETVAEDDPAATIDVLANDADAESDAFTVTSVTQPTNGTVAITNAGADLTYEPDADYCNDGVTTDDFTYTLAPGGATAIVAVTVTCVTDGQVAVDDTETVAEDDPATTIDVLGNDSDPESAGLTVASVTQPTNGTVAITNAGADLTYEPDADYCNDGVTTDDFTYTLGSGDTAEVKVTVTCVNDAPVADDESFTGASAAVGNTVLVVDDATDAAPSEPGPHKTVTGDLLAGDTDPEGDTLTVTAETVTSTDGGSAVIEADGDFVFTPAPGCTDTTDTFDYELTDGTDTDAGTVTIDLSGCVWYVDNSTTGGDTGVSNAPYDTLVEAQNASSAGNTIYVYDGDDTTTGYSAGITLKADQRLLGELADLVIGSDTLATGVAGKRPTLTNTGADVVTLDDNNTVQGIQVDPNGAGRGIAGGTGDVGGTIADVRIIDVGTAATQPLLELDGTSSLWTISDLTTGNTSATGRTAGSIGVRLDNAGTVTFVDTGSIILTNASAKVLDLNQTSLVNSVIDGAIVTGSSTGGIQAVNSSGSMTLGAVNLTTSGGTAFALTGSTGWSVPNIGSATAQILATAGPALDVQSSNATLSFDYVNSTNSTGDGINLDGLGTGTFTATDGQIGGAAGIAFDVNGGNGAITYSGSIINGSGDSVEVTGRTGGTVSFTGAVSDTNDAGGGINLNANTGGTTQFTASSVTAQTTTTNAVSMTASDGHTLQLTGGSLLLSATTGRALNANASGTLVVSGTNNQASTTGGRAISIVTTDIGAADVTFQTVGVQAGTGTNGIVLDTTGTQGGLVVTGGGLSPVECTSADLSGCDGGRLEGLTGGDDTSSVPTGTAIVLKDTTGPSFTNMSIGQNHNFGIRATNVVGLTLDHVVIWESGINQSGVGSIDSNIYATNLTGSVTITDSEINGGSRNNLWVQNTAGDLDRLTIERVVFQELGSHPTNDSVHLESEGTAGALEATISSSGLLGAGGDSLQFLHNGTGAGDLVLTSNAVENRITPASAIADGGGGVSIFSGGAAGTTTMTIDQNTFYGAKGNGVLIVKGAGPSTQTGTLTNNEVGYTNPDRQSSLDGAALKLWSLGQGTMAWTVSGNQIQNYGLSGIEVQVGDVPGQSGSLQTTITNNSITNPGAGTGLAIFGIRLTAGTGAGDTYQVCADIQDNAVNTSGDADGGAPYVPGDADVRLRQRFGTTVRLPGYAGGNLDTTMVTTFVNGNNNVPAGTTSSATVDATGGGFVGGAACATPTP